MTLYAACACADLRVGGSSPGLCMFFLFSYYGEEVLGNWAKHFLSSKNLYVYFL